MTTHTVTLNEYQIANLRAAIEAAGYGDAKHPHVPRNPLWVLNSGDWLGELYQLLPEVDWKPNRTPGETAALSVAFVEGFVAGHAAELRAACRAAVASYPGHVATPPEIQAWWAAFYVAILDHTTGVTQET